MTQLTPLAHLWDEVARLDPRPENAGAFIASRLFVHHNRFSLYDLVASIQGDLDRKQRLGDRTGEDPDNFLANFVHQIDTEANTLSTSRFSNFLADADAFFVQGANAQILAVWKAARSTAQRFCEDHPPETARMALCAAIALYALTPPGLHAWFFFHRPAITDDVLLRLCLEAFEWELNTMHENEAVHHKRHCLEGHHFFHTDPKACLQGTTPGAEQYENGEVLFVYRHCRYCHSSIGVEPAIVDQAIGPTLPMPPRLVR